MNDSFDLEQGFSDLAEVEKTIFAARNYVVASEDLRPRTLERARELCGQGFVLRRLGLYAAASLLAWCACLPTARALSVFRTQLVAPSTEEMHRIALELSAQKGCSPDWGLVEAFEQLRGYGIDRTNPAQLNLFLK